MRLESELCEFLGRLGLTIETRKGGRIFARRRTALMEEELRYVVSEDGTAKVPRRATMIVPSDAAAPAGQQETRWFRFDDFLDHAVQADRIARETASLQFDPD